MRREWAGLPKIADLTGEAGHAPSPTVTGAAEGKRRGDLKRVEHSDKNKTVLQFDPLESDVHSVRAKGLTTRGLNPSMSKNHQT